MPSGPGSLRRDIRVSKTGMYSITSAVKTWAVDGVAQVRGL